MKGVESMNKKVGSRPGAGRPAVSDEEFRKPRSFKATDSEWEQIKAKAKKAGVPASEYIRTKTME